MTDSERQDERINQLQRDVDRQETRLHAQETTCADTRRELEGRNSRIEALLQSLVDKFDQQELVVNAVKEVLREMKSHRTDQATIVAATRRATFSLIGVALTIVGNILLALLT